MHRPAVRNALVLAVAAALVAGTASCSSGITTSTATTTTAGSVRPTAGPTSGSTPGSAPGSTAPLVRAVVASEQEVDGAYRQGLARTAGGWVFSTNLALYRTDDALARVTQDEAAIPATWAAQGFNHIGDVDVAGEVVYAPIEQPDYGAMRQVMATYDVATLRFTGAVEVPQSHNAWVAVDQATGRAYSMSGYSDDTVVVYDVRGGWRALDPIRLDRRIERVQGGDVRDGALWLSTDDERDGLYRVELASGEVREIGSLGRVDGEAEGIDATVLPSGDLHALTIDAAFLPVRLVHLRVG